jgi:hypothetical protein
MANSASLPQPQLPVTFAPGTSTKKKSTKEKSKPGTSTKVGSKTKKRPAINTSNSINKSDIKKYYEYFMEKYREHYQQCIGVNQCLDSHVYYRLYNLSFYPKNPLNNSVENYKTIFSEPGVKLSIDILINTNIKYAHDCLSNINNLPTFTKYILCHGVQTLDIQTVPNKCILILLQPYGRIGLDHTGTYTKRDLIQKIKDKIFFTDFLKNPLCYQKNEFNGPFENYSIYLSNQSYYDIELSHYEVIDQNIDIAADYSGIKNIDYQKNRINTTRIANIQNPSIRLSNIINQNTEGLIIVDCCRGYIYNKDLLNLSVKLKQYETFIKILNKSVYFYNNRDAYDSCDRFTYFIKQSLQKNSTVDIYFKHKLEKAQNPSTQQRIQRYIDALDRFQPKRVFLTTQHSNANSQTTDTLQRLIPKLLPELFIYINDPLFSYNAENKSLKTLFNTFMLKDIHIFFNYLQHVNEIMMKRNDNLKTKYIMSFNLIISYIIYKFIENDKDQNNIDNINKIFEIIEQYSQLFQINIYLTGLDITSEKLKIFFDKYINDNTNTDNKSVKFNFTNLFLKYNNIQYLYKNFLFFKNINDELIIHNCKLNLYNNPVNIDNPNLSGSGIEPNDVIDKTFLDEYLKTNTNKTSENSYILELIDLFRPVPIPNQNTTTNNSNPKRPRIGTNAKTNETNAKTNSI